MYITGLYMYNSTWYSNSLVNLMKMCQFVFTTSYGVYVVDFPAT